MQEHMIHEGYSPYFMKYGYADFPAYHDRYTAAERMAAHRGMWDQFSVNGYEVRNYAVFGVWWHLRADAIDYRSAKLSNPDLLDSRRDYQQLLELAKSETEATVFTELRKYRMAGRHIVVTIGSFQQPFQVFIPNGVETGQDILRLLDNRYIAAGEIAQRLCLCPRAAQIVPRQAGNDRDFSDSDCGFADHVRNRYSDRASHTLYFSFVSEKKDWFVGRNCSAPRRGGCIIRKELTDAVVIK